MSSQARLAIRAIVCALGVAALVGGCQDYVFELRTPKRVDARQINEVVATLTPADILLVIDNSPTMGEEITELQNNVERFVEYLAARDLNYQVGIITTDVECNLPTKSCGVGGSSEACCALDPTVCTETDDLNDPDTKIDSSTCEGGRIQAATPAGRRIFARPSDGERAQWVSDFVATIEKAKNGLKGSAYESGLEAVSRAVGCGVAGMSCDDQAVRDLNEGFFRPEADLVVIFLTDEDDCSAVDSEAYKRPSNPANATDQELHFCQPAECYAYYGEADDFDMDGVQDWADTNPPLASGVSPTRKLRCVSSDRVVNPPPLRDPNEFLNRLIAYKGGVGRIRAAGIISAVENTGGELEAKACWNNIAGPSAECGCLRASPNEFFCEVTGKNGQSSSRTPVRTPSTDGGCDTQPSGRYVQFLNALGDARQAANLKRNVLIDSICRDRYDDTLRKIVDDVILETCFDLGASVAGPADVRVSLNGAVLPNVPVDGTARGWSLQGQNNQVCLEGGLTKNIDDKYEILLIPSTR